MENLSKDKLRVAIVGTGSVGGIFAACLIDAGHEVSVADVRPEILDAIRTEGIQIHGKLDLHVKPAHVYEGLDILKHGPYDLVFLILKVPVLMSLADKIAKADQPENIYVVACNGVDSEAPLIEKLGPKRVHRAVLNFAASVEAPAKINFVGIMGDHLVGPNDPSCMLVSKKIAQLLTDAHLPTVPVENIQDKVWEKAILNAALSALCSVTRLTMKTVLDHEDGHEFVKSLLREAVDVAMAKGVHLADGFFEGAVAYLKRASNHYPSMYWDLIEGRPVEIEAVNGAIVRAGEKYGVATPYNHALTALVRMIRDNR